MNRLTRLMNQYNGNNQQSKNEIAKQGFVAGFMAARKMCSVMGKIAQIEGNDIEQEILKVGTEEIDVNPNKAVVDAPFEVTGIINTLE